MGSDRPLAVQILYTKRAEQFLHVRRKGTVERQTTLCYRMDEAKVRCVQRLPLEIQLLEQFALTFFARAAIDRIAEQRMADRGHVHPHLVGAPGLEPAFDQRRIASARSAASNGSPRACRRPAASTIAIFLRSCGERARGASTVPSACRGTPDTIAR